MSLMKFNRAKAFATTIFLVGMTLTACGQKEAENARVPPAIKVRVKDLSRDVLEVSSEYIGSLEAQQKVNLASSVDGRIINILKREGEIVKKGDLIVELQLNREKGEVESALSDVNIQEANKRSAEVDLKATEAEVASVAATVEESRADLKEQEAELELAKINLERAKFLVKEGAQSKQVLDDRTKDLNAAIAKRNALVAALNAKEKELNVARERVSSARAGVERQKAAVRQAQTRVGIARENLEFNRITAPIDGIVGNIIPQSGDYVRAGDSITNIIENNILELNVAVPIELASRLKLGLAIEVLDNNKEVVGSGTINFISPRVDPGQQSVLVKANVINKKNLQDNSFARARIIWSQKPGVLIPTDSVSRIAGKSFVFVAEENSESGLVAKQIPVTLGDIQGQSYQVISGVESGDKLIVSNILNLADGVSITVNDEVTTRFE